MADVFAVIDATVVRSEGGFSNNPSDPGGATNYGITQATLSGWRKRSVTVQDVRDLTYQEAQSIRRANYWDHISGDDLPAPLALAVYDSAINNGPRKAALLLQLSVGMEQDGEIGKLTLAAVRKRSVASTLAEFQARRAHWQLSLPTAATFGLGWARRLMTVLLAAQALEGLAPAAPVPVQPVPVPGGAVVPTPPPPPPTAPQDETAATEALNERALTDALNLRPPT